MLSLSLEHIVPLLLCVAQVRDDWAAAYAKAATALTKLSNIDKVNLATGIGWEKGPCVGNIKANPTIGFPELCLQDSPLG